MGIKMGRAFFFEGSNSDLQRGKSFNKGLHNKI